MPNQRFLARLKQIGRIAVVLFLSLISILFAGCAGGSPRVKLFGESPTPTPTATPSTARTSNSSTSAQKATGHANAKTAEQARAASENAAAASREAAIASVAAAKASKQAASVANQIEGHGPTSADVSLESKPPASAPDAPIAAAGTRAAALSSGAITSGHIVVASVARTAPAMSPPALESPDQGDPAKAAKLIEDIDKIEKRVDRNKLNADDSQRDLIAQKLLVQAKEALTERDSVAASSLATKASALIEPLPKLADSAIPPAP